MGIDFPASPSVGQKFPQPSVDGQPVYTWDGEKWTTAGGAIGGQSPVYTDGSTAMTAQLTLVTPPVSTTHAATKAYVDAVDTTAVKYIPQTILTSQQESARRNIDAAPLDAMAYSGMQINGSCDISQEWGSTPIYIGTSNGNVRMLEGWHMGTSGPQAPSYGVNGQGVFSANTAPGFKNCASFWSNVANVSPAAGDYFMFMHYIEGYRVSRLGWGTASAHPISIGFWFNSRDRAGMHSISIRSGDNNRSYTATFQVNAANAWEWKTFTIPGCTDGTWDKTNGIGLAVLVAVQCGTSWQTAPGVWTVGNWLGATGTSNTIINAYQYWGITGLIVIPGNQVPTAERSPYIMRPYLDELLICSRYFGVNRYGEPGYFMGGNSSLFWHTPLVPYRTSPAVALITGSFYMEGQPWALGINVTGGSIGNAHVQPTGLDYIIVGTYSATPSLGVNTTMEMMTDRVVKFDARF